MSEEIDFETRRLCPDDACIGVIGPDGRCGECGRADDGSVQAAAPRVDDVEPETAREAAADEPDSGDDERELCPNGECIGLIGPDGKCKECGTPRSS